MSRSINVYVCENLVAHFNAQSGRPHSKDSFREFKKLFTCEKLSFCGRTFRSTKALHEATRNHQLLDFPQTLSHRRGHTETRVSMYIPKFT